MTIPIWTASQVAAARAINRMALHNGIAVTLELVGGEVEVQAAQELYLQNVRAELNDAESMLEVMYVLGNMVREDGLQPMAVHMMLREQEERLL